MGSLDGYEMLATMEMVVSSPVYMRVCYCYPWELGADHCRWRTPAPGPITTQPNIQHSRETDAFIYFMNGGKCGTSELSNKIIVR